MNGCRRMPTGPGGLVKPLFGLLVAMLLLLSVPGHGAGDNRAAEALTAILAQTRTLSATVEQLTLDQQGREVRESRAVLKMRKPDQFYWRTTSPYEEVLVTDGETLWIHEPDLGQVTIEHFDKAYSQTPAMLLTSDAETLAGDFEITMTSPSEERRRFTLVPEASDALFVELSLTFHGGVLREMQFEDSLGQRSSLSFKDARRNERMADDLFTFEVPAGVEVIDSRSGS